MENQMTIQCPAGINTCLHCCFLEDRQPIVVGRDIKYKCCVTDDLKYQSDRSCPKWSRFSGSTLPTTDKKMLYRIDGTITLAQFLEFIECYEGELIVRDNTVTGGDGIKFKVGSK